MKELVAGLGLGGLILISAGLIAYPVDHGPGRMILIGVVMLAWSYFFWRGNTR